MVSFLKVRDFSFQVTSNMIHLLYVGIDAYNMPYRNTSLPMRSVAIFLTEQPKEILMSHNLPNHPWQKFGKLLRNWPIWACSVLKSIYFFQAEPLPTLGEMFRQTSYLSDYEKWHYYANKLHWLKEEWDVTLWFKVHSLPCKGRVRHDCSLPCKGRVRHDCSLFHFLSRSE